jgi:hypothetical protein
LSCQTPRLPNFGKYLAPKCPNSELIVADGIWTPKAFQIWSVAPCFLQRITVQFTAELEFAEFSEFLSVRGKEVESVLFEWEDLNLY